jgi:spermidine synthase
MSSTTRRYFVFFVVSGFCGLVCEVVWLRLAMASFGVTTALASIVLSMFMAGLALGSWGAGALTRDVRSGAAARALRLYSLAELLVGLSSLVVPFELTLGRHVVQTLGSTAAWQSSRYYLFTGMWVALTLIPWCACMGSTFPLLMAVLRRQPRYASERSFSYLYMANVLGALLGTIVSAFVLIELFGFTGTLYVVCVLNSLIAISAFALSFQSADSASVPDAVPQEARRSLLYGLPKNAVLWMLFATGFVSMGLEVVWIRQFTPYLGNVVYAFAGIVAVYLLATLLGSQDYRFWARSHDPGESAASWSLLALFSIIPMIAADPKMPFRIGHLELAGLRLSAIVFFCSLAGFLTPLLVDSRSSGDPGRAGRAYAANIAGSLLGPLAAGLWLLPRFGERGATVALTLPLFAIAAVTALRPAAFEAPSRGRKLSPKLRFAVATSASVLILLVSHDYETKYPVRQVRRDYSATVIATGRGFDSELLVNGIGMTRLTPVTKYMAHLPLAFMSRPPRKGLVICFGMGTSFRSMLSWGISTTAVDLIPSVPMFFGYFHADALALLQSPRARVVADDGRRFLDGSPDSYDVIVVDPPPPPAAPGSSLLYSREFYDVAKKHLGTNGIVQMWYPSAEGDVGSASSIAKALTQSFPHVRAFHAFAGEEGVHFLASMDPLPTVSSEELASRLPAAAADDFVEWGPASNASDQFALVLSREVTTDALIAAAPRAPALSDDGPINEYFLLREWFRYYR